MLLKTMQDLRDLGNTLLVVEHDEDTMRAADYIIDVGPGAGVHGGEIVAAGTPEEVMNTPAPSPASICPGAERSPSPGAAEGEREASEGIWGGREQPSAHRCGDPPWDLHLCHRGVRLGQVLSGERDPV